MPDDSKTYILDDQWTDEDALDFTPYVETLADIIQTGNTPLTIGVFGTWGSGKTSLMRMIKKQLPNDFTIAWFDAWKYDKEESLWRAFLLCVLNALKERASLQGKPVEEFEKLQSLIYRDMEIERVGGVTIDLAKLGGVTAKGLAQLSLSFIPGLSTLTKLVEELQSGVAKSVDEATAAIRRERTKIYIEQIQFLEQFQNRFRELVQEHVQPNRFVVFIDDLDRCLPEKSIGVLEAIKLFLDVENCVFVLGLDQEVIARGIEMKYMELGAKQDSDNQQHFTIEGVRYLEKIVQLPFYILPADRADMGNFVSDLTTEWPHEECPKVFAEGLGDNPRQIKRTVNTFLMLWKLAEKRKAKIQERVKPIRLAKIVAIQTAYPDLYNLLLRDEPRYLRELEEYYRAEHITPILDTDGKATESINIDKPEPPPALVPFLSRRGASAVRRILTLHNSEMSNANFEGLPPDEIRLYFTLARLANAPQTISQKEAVPLVFEPQMIKIPAGNFLMGSTPEWIAQAIIKNGADKDWIQNEAPQHPVELSEYSIGKYPITNREYQAFLRTAKYNPPRGWDGDQFPAEMGGHPVANVSWNDATAYCKWLSEKTNRHYRLPTEAEWEKAARGEAGLIYPWGDTFDSSNANTYEARLGGTSEVGQFSPQGDSPYGCVDMAGNVWEWTNSLFKSYPYHADDGREDMHSNEARVLRGSSFVNHHRYAHCASRHVVFSYDVGFRVCVSQSH